MEEINGLMSIMFVFIALSMAVVLGVITYFSIRALIMYVRYKNVDEGVRARHEMTQVKKNFSIFSYLLLSFIVLSGVNVGLEMYEDELNGEFKQIELAEESEKKSEMNDAEQTVPEVTTELQTEVVQEPIAEPEPEPIPVVAPAPVPVSQPEPIPEPIHEPDVEYGVYVDENGNGLIKGSNGGKYHVPGSQYYNNTTKPKAMFKSIKEAQAAGYVAPR